MKQGVLRWTALLALLGCAVLLLAFRVPQKVSDIRDKHEHIRGLQKQNADLAKDIAEKRDRIRKLRESRSEQELVIRERLKLQRPGDTTIVPDPAKK